MDYKAPLETYNGKVVEVVLGKGDAALGMKYQLDAFEEAERLRDSQITARIGSFLSFSLDIAGEYFDAHEI